MNEQVTSVAELDALPVGWAGIGVDGNIWQRVDARVKWQSLTGGGYTYESDFIRECAPLATLYRPDQPQRVQPSREGVVAALKGVWFNLSDEFLGRFSDAVLALFASAPTVAEVKAEALREAANDENSEWARKRTEDELIEFRDARIGLMNRRNGLVVYERDGEPSSIIRLGFEVAWKSALRDLADRIEREARP